MIARSSCRYMLYICVCTANGYEYIDMYVWITPGSRLRFISYAETGIWEIVDQGVWCADCRV